MIREIMSSFSGNELVIGLALGAWLLFTGLGSALGVPLSKKVKPEKVLFWGHILIALLPFAQIAAIRALPLLWVRGVMLDLGSAVFFGTLVLLSYCLVAGAMIPVAGALLRGRQTTSKVYFADTVGDIAGGLIFSLIFVYTLSHWDSMVCLGLLNLLAAAVMASRGAHILLIVLGLGIIMSRPFHGITTSWRFPGQQVILHKNTPFAQLTISRTGEQINVLQDAIPLFSTNALEMEAKAHLPLCQVQEGAHVLLVAGGVFGTIDEIAKHHPRRIDYVELDPAIADLDSVIGGSLAHPFVRLYIGDGRLFVKQASRKYDVIVVDLPDPESTQLNRFYSEEFFRETKAILNPDGVLSFTLVGAENYLEEMGLAVNRSVYSAVNRVFEHVVVFPGPTHHYLASDGPLTSEVADVLLQRNIVTKYFADYELPTMTDPFRMEFLKELLAETEAPANRDLSPKAFGHLLDMWLKKSESPKALVYILFASSVVFAVLACRRHLVSFTVMTSGYAGMAFELSLLLLFQVIYGYVYLRICLFITLFMLGSALGAFASGRIKKGHRWQVIVADALLVMLTLVASAVALVGVHWKSPLALLAMQYAVIPLLIFLVAFSAGCQFSAASRMVRGTGAEITGRLYVADLAGAACGTILTGLLFLPKIGIVGGLLSVLLLKGLSLALNVGLKRQTPIVATT
jgi:spermidine synthase